MKYKINMHLFLSFSFFFLFIFGSSALAASPIQFKQPDTLIIHVYNSPQDQHLQYKKIYIKLDTNNDTNAYISDYNISANLQNFVHVCNATLHKGDALCEQNYLSTCALHTSLQPGQSCYFWLKSIDVNRFVPQTQGLFKVKFEDDLGKQKEASLGISYRMDLYFAGNCIQYKSNYCNSLVRFDGQKYTPLDPNYTLEEMYKNFNYPFFSAGALYDGDLYLGGFVQKAAGQAAQDIVTWDGMKYNVNICHDEHGSLLCGPLSQGPFYGINAMSVYNHTLYIGGSFNISTSNGGSTYNMASWSYQSPSSWQAVGNPLGNSWGNVQTMNVANGLLYVGGYFGYNNTSMIPSFTAWDGQKWISIGGALDPSETVSVISDIEDKDLFVGASHYPNYHNNPTIYQLVNGNLQTAFNFSQNFSGVAGFAYYHGSYYLATQENLDIVTQADVYRWSIQFQQWQSTQVNSNDITIVPTGLLVFNDQLYLSEAGLRPLLVYNGTSWSEVLNTDHEPITAFQSTIIPASSLTPSFMNN